MNLSLALIDLFDSSEGLVKLIDGFHRNLEKRANEKPKDKSFLEELKKLIEESNKLKIKLQEILNSETESELDLESIQNDFIHLLMRADGLSMQFLSKPMSFSHDI